MLCFEPPGRAAAARDSGHPKMSTSHKIPFLSHTATASTLPLTLAGPMGGCGGGGTGARRCRARICRRRRRGGRGRRLAIQHRPRHLGCGSSAHTCRQWEQSGPHLLFLLAALLACGCAVGRMRRGARLDPARGGGHGRSISGVPGGCPQRAAAGCGAGPAGVGCCRGAVPGGGRRRGCAGGVPARAGAVGEAALVQRSEVCAWERGHTAAPAHHAANHQPPILRSRRPTRSPCPYTPEPAFCPPRRRRTQVGWCGRRAPSFWARPSGCVWRRHSEGLAAATCQTPASRLCLPRARRSRPPRHLCWRGRDDKEVRSVQKTEGRAKMGCETDERRMG